MGDPQVKTRHIRIQEPSSREVVMALLSNSFRLDVYNSRRLGAEFDTLMVLAEKVPFFNLVYPRRMKALFSVVSHVARHLDHFLLQTD